VAVARCLALVVLGLLAGCGNNVVPKDVFNDDTLFTKAPKVMRYADFAARTRSEKKYILVAGGRDDANFAQEIVDQKKYLLSRGAKESEISCFYAMPFDKSFREDEDQYRSLMGDLADCYPAYSGHVYEEIGNLSQTEDSFIYVTSHGSAPLSWALNHWQLEPEERTHLENLLRDTPANDQFTVSLDANPDGTPSSFASRMRSVKAGMDPRQVHFTPRYLKDALMKARGPLFDAKQFVAIQACYSGGFIDTGIEALKPDLLSSMARLDVMTAARYDRTSFGCGAGNHRTYFGDAFIEATQATGLLPQQIPWTDLHRDVVNRVTLKEEKFRTLLEDPSAFKPSETMLYNSPAAL
jgi:hypothetical protein